LTDGGGEAIDRRTSVDGEMAFLQGINAGIGADSVALGVLLSLFVVFAVAGKCYFFIYLAQSNIGVVGVGVLNYACWV